MSAQLVEHRYSSGTPFWMIECHDCHVVLNSGHHYGARYLENAQRLADDHNRARHPASAELVAYAISHLRQHEQAIRNTIAAYETEADLAYGASYWRPKLASVLAAIAILEGAA